MTTTEYVLLIVLHAIALCSVAYYYAKQYRKSVQSTNRRVSELVLASEVSELKEELSYLRKRNEILLGGLFPRGEVFPGNFINEDPELLALAELMAMLSTSRALDLRKNEDQCLISPSCYSKASTVPINGPMEFSEVWSNCVSPATSHGLVHAAIRMRCSSQVRS